MGGYNAFRFEPLVVAPFEVDEGSSCLGRGDQVCRDLRGMMAGS